MPFPALFALAFAGFVACSTAFAAPPARIEAVQWPAWVERDGQRLPARPGMAIVNRDRLLTGDDSRAWLRLADGSTVRFGERAEAGLHAPAHRPGSPFTAAIDVAAGAVRVTTDTTRPYRPGRAINVRVGEMTASLRGTDVWGRAYAGDDLICLIEGRILVSHPLAEAAELGEPLQFIAAGKHQAPDTVAASHPRAVAGWTATTDLKADAPAFRQGQWGVRVGVAEGEADALEIYDRLGAAGIPARIQPKRSAGGYTYELLAGPLASAADATALASQLRASIAPDEATAVRRQAVFRPR